MRSGDIPFKFDLTDLLARVRRQVAGRMGNVTVNLPFVSIAVSPKDRERRVAREIVLRLRDRRVLSAWECCNDCIDRALTSLKEIRQLIVEKEVELAELQDGPLFLLLDAMATGVRQFMTFEELLLRDEGAPPHPRFGEFHSSTRRAPGLFRRSGNPTRTFEPLFRPDRAHRRYVCTGRWHYRKLSGTLAA